MTSGRIFDIKRYSLHDGPGIRTTVFLQGCPLTCWWCHNPESQSVAPVMHYEHERCLGCEACVATCEEHALVMAPTGIQRDESLCRSCGECAEVCPPEARDLIGRSVGRDSLFFRQIKDL